MNFKELVKVNRTCRRYDNSKEVSMKQLEELVDLARYTPCGANRQSLRFVLINDKEINEKIYDNIAWAGYLKDWDGPVKEERPTGYIVFVSDSQYGKPMLEDVGIASQTISLGARFEGMAVCIFKAYKEEPIKEILELGDKYNIHLVMAIGYPVEEAVIDNIKVGEDIKYYRDKNGVHHVPKIVTEDTIIKKNL